jgi:hypothetical protein
MFGNLAVNRNPIFWGGGGWVRGERDGGEDEAAAALITIYVRTWRLSRRRKVAAI